MDNIMTTYDAVLETQKSTSVSIAAACKSNGVGQTTLSRTKCVDETWNTNLQAGAKNLINSSFETIL